MSNTNPALHRGISRAVRWTRIVKSKRQNQLAAQLGVTGPAMWNMENGRHRWSVDQLVATANFLEVSPAVLLQLAHSANHFEEQPEHWAKVVQLAGESPAAGWITPEGKTPIYVDAGTVLVLRSLLVYGPLAATGVGYTEFIDAAIGIIGQSVALLRRLNPAWNFNNYSWDRPADQAEVEEEI